MSEIETTVTEQELIDRSKAPRVTYEDLQNNINKETFYQHDLLTICVLELANGFTVLGQSACADPANFMQDVGERLARKDAENKIWPLMGYELKTKVALISGSKPATFKDHKTYVGTKVVHAKPMTRGDYNIIRGWTIPDDENPTDAGYLVEYGDQMNVPNHNVPNHGDYAGYISWSPKDVFEGSYVQGATQPEKNYQDRVVDEFRDLVQKKRKLQIFIDDREGVFVNLDPDEKERLRSQWSHMHKYASTLYDRLEAMGQDMRELATEI